MFLLILKVATTLVAELVLLFFTSASFMTASNCFDEADSIDQSRESRESIERTGMLAFLVGVWEVFTNFALTSYFWGIR